MCYYRKKKRYIRVDCYSLKNRKKAAGAINTRKQHVNSTEADVVEDGQNEEEFLAISNMGS